MRVNGQAAFTSGESQKRARTEGFSGDLPHHRRLTDTSTIDLDAFIAGEPMSPYIAPFRPSDLSVYSPLLRVWLSGLILAMTQRNTLPKEVC
jgi:hypothetical protein